MAELYHCRIAFAGDRAQLTALEGALLRNLDVEPAGSLEEMVAAVQREACPTESGEGGFEYAAVTRRPYGSAVDGTAVHGLRDLGRGLLALTFFYDSAAPLQPEDWLRLHLQSGRPTAAAIWAGDRFAQDKGGVFITNGRCYEDWDRMAEAWLWLTHRCGAGLSAGEAAGWKRQLDSLLAREDWDQDAMGLLGSCAAWLDFLGRSSRDAAGLAAQCLADKNWDGLLAARLAAAQCLLWEADRPAAREALARLMEA